jgi:hypothetical protein
MTDVGCKACGRVSYSWQVLVLVLGELSSDEGPRRQLVQA